MSVIPWPDGVPGERQGVAHTLKHWLDPTEMWEDIAESVEVEVRPRAVLASIDLPAPWLEAYTPSALLIARWNQLRKPYREGYLTVVLRGVGEHAVPPDRWTRVDRGARAAALPGGIYAVIVPSSAGWRLASAYRPMDFKLKNPDCPPRDAQSVTLRKRMADGAARRKLARKTQDEP